MRPASTALGRAEGGQGRNQPAEAAWWLREKRASVVSDYQLETPSFLALSPSLPSLSLCLSFKASDSDPDSTDPYSSAGKRAENKVPPLPPPPQCVLLPQLQHRQARAATYIRIYTYTDHDQQLHDRALGASRSTFRISCMSILLSMKYRNRSNPQTHLLGSNSWSWPWLNYTKPHWRAASHPRRSRGLNDRRPLLFVAWLVPAGSFPFLGFPDN